MNDITSTNTKMNTPKSFTRIVTEQYFKDMVKEAKRVKYIVEGKMNELVIVKDDETGEKVFSGMMHSSGKYIANFNTQYWEYPAIGAWVIKGPPAQ